MIEEYNSQQDLVFRRLLKVLAIKNTKIGVDEAIKRIPYAYSLFGFCKALNAYGIENKAIRVNSSDIEKVPTPFVAIINVPDTNLVDFVLIESMNPEETIFFHSETKRIEHKRLIELIAGRPLIAIDKTSSGIEPNYKANKKATQKKTIFNISLVLLVLTFLVFSLVQLMTNWSERIELLFLVLSSVIGLTFAVIALSFEVRPENRFLQKVCSASNSSKNCTAVLTSSSSKFFGIPLALLASSYFFVFVVVSLAASYSELILKMSTFLHHISLIALFIIPASIYLQKVVIKQWCKLCLIIIIILLVNGIISLYYFSFNPFFIQPTPHAVILGVVFITFFLLSFLSFKLLKKFSKLNELVLKANNYLQRKDVLALLLEEYNEINDGWQDIQFIQKGATNYKDLLIKVCNPVCSYCSETHKKLNELILTKPELKVVTIYYLPSDFEDKRSLIACTFIHFALNKQFDKLYDAMDYWYLNKNSTSEELLAKYDLDEKTLSKYTPELNAMYNWCHSSGITYTPTIFWNGRKLPASFDFNLLFKAL